LHAALISAGIMLAFLPDKGITVSHVPLLVYVRAERVAPAPLIMVYAARAPAELLNDTGAVLDVVINVSGGLGTGFLDAGLLSATWRLMRSASSCWATLVAAPQCYAALCASMPGAALLHGQRGNTYVAAVSLYPVLLLIVLSSTLSMAFLFSSLSYRLRLPRDPRGATAILVSFEEAYRRAALAILVLATGAFVLFLARYTGLAGEAFTSAGTMLLLV